jgi:hypothetical protein
MNPKADHVLLHLLPVEVLAKAGALAIRLLREEAFRSYVTRRLWLIFPFSFAVMVFAFFILFFAAVLTADIFVPPPFPTWLRFTLLPVVLLVWTCVSLSFLYVFFGWLERRAHRDVQPNS